VRAARSNRTAEGTEAAVGWIEKHPEMLRCLRRAFRRYYETSRRDLPWRNTADPYRLLVAELLLQKTAVKPVEEVWRALIRRYPTVHALARASLRTVQALIRPLGLHKRARALRDAARVIVREGGGRIPPDPCFLQSLPGVGGYTAATVLSFAHNVKAAAVDVNVARVYARIAGFAPNTLRQGLAFALVVAERVATPKWHRETNYAVIDLAAQVCRPRPACGACPIARLCDTRLAGHV
jgi:A/G-specific adenine glycosylase